MTTLWPVQQEKTLYAVPVKNSKETSNSQNTATEEPKGMGGGRWEIGDHLFYSKLL